eukprot:gene24156-biopygen23879
MKRTIIGQIVECTKKSGWTWRAREGERWARIDSWWASQQAAVTELSLVPNVIVKFSQHRGVGVRWRLRGEDEHGGDGSRQLGRLPDAEDPKWQELRSKLEELLQRTLERGGAAADVAACWDQAARETFPLRPRIVVSPHPAHAGLGPWENWRQVHAEGTQRPVRKARTHFPRAPRKWRAAVTQNRHETRHRKMVEALPASEQWCKWCGETEWRRRLQHVRDVVATGVRVWAELLPPDWETFRAYVAKLPDGKSGAGYLRNEMFKRGGERALRIWFDRVVVPAAHGEWEPNR